MPDPTPPPQATQTAAQINTPQTGQVQVAPPRPPILPKAKQKQRVQPQPRKQLPAPGKLLSHGGKPRPTAAALADLQANKDIPDDFRASMLRLAQSLNAEVLAIDFHMHSDFDQNPQNIVGRFHIKKVS